MSVLEDAAAWAAETFPDAGMINHRVKVMEEYREWLGSTGSIESLEEAADIVICLAAWAERAGWNLEQAIQAKLEKNKTRTWKRQANGTYRHV